MNYRGSLSFGEATCRVLKGHIGDLDLADCAQAVADAAAPAVGDLPFHTADD